MNRSTAPVISLRSIIQQTLVGGPDVVTQFLRDLGVNGIVVANTEKEIGQDKAVQYRNYASPNAAVVLLRALHEGQGLSKSSQALLLQLMTDTTTGSKRIKGLLPDGTVVAHKTGTSSTVQDLRINTIYSVYEEPELQAAKG